MAKLTSAVESSTPTRELEDALIESAPRNTPASSEIRLMSATLFPLFLQSLRKAKHAVSETSTMSRRGADAHFTALYARTTLMFGIPSVLITQFPQASRASLLGFVQMQFSCSRKSSLLPSRASQYYIIRVYHYQHFPSRSEKGTNGVRRKEDLAIF